MVSSIFFRATDQIASPQCVGLASANGGLAEQTHYQLVVHVGKIDQRTIGVGEDLAVSIGPDWKGHRGVSYQTLRHVGVQEVQTWNFLCFVQLSFHWKFFVAQNLFQQYILDNSAKNLLNKYIFFRNIQGAWIDTDHNSCWSCKHVLPYFKYNEKNLGHSLIHALL